MTSRTDLLAPALGLLLLIVSAPLARADEAAAAELYRTHCSGCHGVNLEGAQYTALRKERFLYALDGRGMLRIVLYGIPGTDMAAFSGALSEEEAQAVVDYILAAQDRSSDEVKPFPETIRTADYLLKAETLVDEGFRSSPWSIEFVDERRALITERRGGLRWLVDGKLDPSPIEGLPTPTQYGDSGMYDIALDPDYGQNGWIYLAYVHALGDPFTRDTPAMTRIVRGRVHEGRWVEEETVFRVADELHFAQGMRWGCRLLFDRQGLLYFSIGDIGRNDEVQQLDKPGGKVYRIRRDGSIPEDNPYAGKPDALGAVFSIGNRNVQGIDQHPETGEIWGTEHGPMGGDELNILRLGANYGWPTITYGLDYDGSVISDITHKEGMEQPAKYWTPSPGLSALEFYSGDEFPEWKNDALVGALRFEEVKRLETEGDRVVKEEVLLKGHGRVRDLKTGPDGALYLVLNNPHRIVRLSRAD